MFALVELSIAAHAADPVSVPLGKGTLLYVEDHRVPLVWATVVVPVGTYERAAHRASLGSLWGPAVNVLLRYNEADADVLPWTGPYATGIDVVVLRRDARDAVKAVSAAMDDSFPSIHVPARSFRPDRRVLRTSPSIVLETTLEDLYYERADARREWTTRLRGSVDDEDLDEARELVAGRAGWAVGVAGDVTLEEAKGIAGRLTEFLEAGADGGKLALFDQAIYPVRGTPPPLTIREVPGAAEALLAWARPAPTGTARTEPGSRAAALIADDLVSRDLTDLLRARRAETYTVETNGLLGGGIYSMVSTTSPGRVEAQSLAVRELLDRVAREGYPPEAIDAARVRLLARAARASESPAHRLEDAVEKLLWPDQPDVAALLAEGRSPTAEQVNTFVRAFYDPAQFGEVWVVPKGSGYQPTR